MFFGRNLEMPYQSLEMRSTFIFYPMGKELVKETHPNKNN
jgi:hypothetical protein